MIILNETDLLCAPIVRLARALAVDVVARGVVLTDARVHAAHAETLHALLITPLTCPPW